MAQLKKAWHDERRAKEALDREKEEAIKYAQNIINENKKLKLLYRRVKKIILKHSKKSTKLIY
jgi:hypothetical protein